MQNFKMHVDIKVTQTGRGPKPKYSLDADLDGEYTLKDLLEFTKSSLIVLADQVLKEEQSKGFDKKPIVVVDGKRGKPVEAVHPLGQIEFVSTADVGGVILEAYQGLLDRSKVLTGRYKASHYVFHNGNQVATDFNSLRSWLGFALLGQSQKFKPGDTIRIVNIQPYGRKLELLGVTAQRQRVKNTEKKKGGAGTGTFIRVPNGAYQLTTRSIKAKYKNNLDIRFSFLSGAALGLSASFKGGKKSSKGRPYLYPSMIFNLRERGAA